MNPFFFGTRERRLFGVYHAGRGGPSGARAAVLCHPLGQEYLRAHRSMSHLGNLLGRAGVHVLRFDWYGTGDSGGDLADGDLAGWQEDLATAVDELKDTTGADRVGLVGLRLGATLAAAVARRREDVDTVVLWDPVVTGAEYAGELERDASQAGPGAPREILGFVYPDRLFDELRSVDLLSMIPELPGTVRVVVTQPLASHGELRARLSARAPPAELEEVPSPPAWIEERIGEREIGAGALPVQALQRIARSWEAAP
jgi:pimeloyl-ACP methyl ester carboxylesterase